MENQPPILCPFCNTTIENTAYFCPNCGKQLKNTPSDTSTLKKIVVYAVSLLLPPFGLWYAWKYLQTGDYESRKVGVIAIVLTILSIIVTFIVTFWITADFMNSLFQSLNGLNGL